MMTTTSTATTAALLTNHKNIIVTLNTIAVGLCAVCPCTSPGAYTLHAHRHGAHTVRARLHPLIAFTAAKVSSALAIEMWSVFLGVRSVWPRTDRLAIGPTDRPTDRAPHSCQRTFSEWNTFRYFFDSVIEWLALSHTSFCVSRVVDAAWL